MQKKLIKASTETATNAALLMYTDEKKKIFSEHRCFIPVKLTILPLSAVVLRVIVQL